MQIFTYADYLKCSKSFPEGVREETAKYVFDEEQERIHQYKDKIFKEILSDKKEFIKFIQKYLNIDKFQNLTENDVEKYNKEFITANFEKRESDTIYKISKFNAYIMIEHQSQIDYKMPMRITEYSVELMRDIIRSGKNEIGNLPVIIPIVLYTGNRKWKIPNKYEEIDTFGVKAFEYTKYNLVDINDYAKEELIKENTGMSKALLFEKINSKEDLEGVMSEISKKELTVGENKYISLMLKYSNKIRKITPNGVEEYLKKLERGGNEDMKFEKLFMELLEDKERKGKIEGEKRGEERGEKLGIAKAITQMVKGMLQKQMTDEDIMDIAKIDRKELEKLKMA